MQVKAKENITWSLCVSFIFFTIDYLKSLDKITEVHATIC